MKKRNLATLAMLGIGVGLAVGGCQQQGNKGNNKGSADEQMSPDMESYYKSLSPDAQQKFMQLDAQHRMMAVEMAHQSCSGKNKCAGMGGCATASHKCAGKNSCKGQGGAPIKDANKAVEAQYQNQMNQRQQMSSGMGQSNAPSTSGMSQGTTGTGMGPNSSGTGQSNHNSGYNPSNYNIPNPNQPPSAYSGTNQAPSSHSSTNPSTSPNSGMNQGSNQPYRQNY